ncbi:1-aminocyclopropane-1-carboxylate deaminase [Sulfurimonas paralvinellae]|uniref:Pyridoxal-phosphate dependent enzyme n=1 Tax=Sulfurimonas paralvinellae TaxID=317658 RepID=A0A7M1B9T9_9BACT|nr:1-aminocyclopropane-1-carboxylate deaminase [Sulfurimonas paralvinellae]QOP46236.1 pyridoxal-phosphate dependent enzyme [Sulfurimonas paralvinellae]
MQLSPLSKIILDTREFLVKRDDLIDPYLAGNKYRKLYTLLQTPKELYHTIISYGGTQSNAMLAIAAMCRQKGWNFIYYSKPLSRQQRENTLGNFATALALGMTHHEIEHELYRDFIASLRLNLDEKIFILDQGGAVTEAKEGLEVLADELREQLREHKDIQSLATPSGTGTTAYFLALALPEYRIYTTPSVGDVSYLKEQMLALGKLPKNLHILESKKKYHFAKPYPEFYEMYQKLKSGGIEFDLLYAPLMWQTLLEQTDERILYIHSGGVSGNASMLPRYKNIDKGILK